MSSLRGGETRLLAKGGSLGRQVWMNVKPAGGETRLPVFVLGTFMV
ncbi:MAG: hypothetical protein HYZ51_04535 [Candidatus Doudnabacteria bacterium]|nr:hypothetical protein [Candidatus Doudnabacteria bacterium]